MTQALPSVLSVLVIGAASDMGRAFAYNYASTGASLILAARNVERLTADAEDLRLRHCIDVELAECDVLAVDAHHTFLDGLAKLPDLAICVVGLLGDQAVSARNSQAARHVIDTNYVGPALLLGEIANRFEARGSGTIVGVSSVAGDRGRASNYIYGSAKAGFTAFLSGLRARLSRTPVHVITVKPGFVATRMTANINLPPALTAQPSEVAEAVRRAVEKRYDVLYVRPVWRFLMTVVRLLPESIFKKIKN